MGTMAAKLAGFCDPVQAEMMAVWMGLQLSRDLFLTECITETDYGALVSKINAAGPNRSP